MRNKSHTTQYDSDPHINHWCKKHRFYAEMVTHITTWN